MLNRLPGAKLLLFLFVAGLVAIAGVAQLPFPPSPAQAHGNELEIAVAPLVPDPHQPLRRLYRVQVVYAGDREPVQGARVMLAARRTDTAALSPLQLTEVEHAPGLYVGELLFERFGSYQVTLEVTAALGQGDGRVVFNDEIRPRPISAEEEAAQRVEADRVIRLQAFFAFGWWPDVVNVAMRIVHSLAGVAYFIGVGLAFGLAWFGPPANPGDFLRHLQRFFLPATVISLTALLGAGLYAAYFDAPVAPPGIYDLSRMRQIPYGDSYLIAFLIKLVLFAVLAVLAFRIHRSLQRWNLGGPNNALTATLRWETLACAIAGVAAASDAAVLIYLHYVSHLGVFIPSQ